MKNIEEIVENLAKKIIKMSEKEIDKSMAEIANKMLGLGVDYEDIIFLCSLAIRAEQIKKIEELKEINNYTEEILNFFDSSNNDI